MIDEVDRLSDEERLDDVGVHEAERFGSQVLDVGERPGFQIVDADHAVIVRQ